MNRSLLSWSGESRQALLMQAHRELQAIVAKKQAARVAKKLQAQHPLAQTTKRSRLRWIACAP